MSRPSDELCALTLWEPWATLIALGVKPFETRSWATPYRGLVAIHAGIDRRGLALCEGESEIEESLAAAGLSLDPRSLPLGRVVRVARLAECWPTEAIVADDLDDAFGDYSPGRFGWHLHRVQRLLQPIRATGRQGLWTPGPELRAEIARQLAPADAAIPAGGKGRL
jgi:activating signal cointegrator 1